MSAAAPSEAAAIATAAAADGLGTNVAPGEGLVLAAASAASVSRPPQFEGQDRAAAPSSAVSGALEDSNIESDSDLATSESDDDDDGSLLHRLLDQVGEGALHLVMQHTTH